MFRVPPALQRYTLFSHDTQTAHTNTNANTNGTFAQTGKYVIASSRETECYTGVYWYLLPFGIIGVLMYPVGIPAACAYLLATKPKTLGRDKFVIRYGFLAGRFRVECYYHELIIMARKLGEWV